MPRTLVARGFFVQSLERSLMSDENDPYEADVEEPDKEPVPGLGEPDVDEVCTPTEPVGE